MVTVANAGTNILMVDYEPKEGSSFPFEDAVLNWSVYNHGQMGEATGRWIAEHMKSQGKDSADVIMIWGPISRSPGTRASAIGRRCERHRSARSENHGQPTPSRPRVA